MLRFILEPFCFILDLQLFIEEVFEMLMKAETSSGQNTPMTRAFQNDAVKKELLHYETITVQHKKLCESDLMTSA